LPGIYYCLATVTKLPTTILFLDTKSFVIRADTFVSASHYNPIQRPKTHAYTRHHLPDRVAHDAFSF